MTSVPFDLNVAILTNQGRRETYGSVEFRFTTKAARALERAAGSGIGWLIARGQSVEAMVLLLCYGLQWAFPKMTEDKAVDIIDAYISPERKGNAKDLSDALAKALQESGVYGRSEDEGERPLDPTTTETTETPAGASVTG